jgi:hypothetical protein
VDTGDILGGEQLSLARAAVKGGAVVVPGVLSQPFHQPAARDAKALGCGFEGKADALRGHLGGSGRGIQWVGSILI